MGWIGLGFSPTGGMAGADMIMAWIDSSNIIHFTVCIINIFFIIVTLHYIFQFYIKSIDINPINIKVYLYIRIDTVRKMVYHQKINLKITL